MKKKIIIYAIILSVILGVVFLRISSKNKSKFVSVKSNLAMKGDVESYLSTTGTIKSKTSKSYYGLQGKVKKVNVSVGDKVSKGQVLVTFETTDLSASVKQAEIQYNNAVLSKQDLTDQNNTINSKIADLDKQIADLDAQIASAPKETVQTLISKQSGLKTSRGQLQPISDEKLKQADNSVSLANISLNTAKENLAKNVNSITSDIDGVVTSLTAVEGSVASAAQPMVIVQDINSLKLMVSVGKYDANKIQLGQEAKIKTQGKEYKGKVSFINPAAQKSGTPGATDTILGVEVDVLENAPELKIDFDTDVDILTGKVANVLKVPAESIKSEKTGKNFVYIIVGSKAVEKIVTIGLQSDLEVEVKDGIKEGDKVILNPGATIKDGSLIKEAGVK
jgi:HlyD family secretion protein